MQEGARQEEATYHFATILDEKLMIVSTDQGAFRNTIKAPSSELARKAGELALLREVERKNLVGETFRVSDDKGLATGEPPDHVRMFLV